MTKTKTARHHVRTDLWGNGYHNCQVLFRFLGVLIYGENVWRDRRHPFCDDYYDSIEFDTWLRNRIDEQMKDYDESHSQS